MKIDRVTITGADETVSPEALAELVQQYPFLELGILFGSSVKPGLRYPDVKWINELVKVVPAKNLSAHLCGKYSRALLDELDKTFLKNDNFGRLQLNYSFPGNNRLSELLDLLPKYKKHVILQYNSRNNTHVLNGSTAGRPYLDFLHDSSGGRGIFIGNRLPKLGNDLNFWGYAGGIGPDNILKVCSLIEADPRTRSTWIDMESGVRTKDNFDISKAKAVLDIAKIFIAISEF